MRAYSELKNQLLQKEEIKVEYDRLKNEQKIIGTALAAPIIFGSPNWARTSDIMINSHALYRLTVNHNP